jgi:plasmid stabilization system protein ParE
MPERCALARENEYFEDELRQLLFKSHRIIFRVERSERIVRVLYVRHGRQRAIGEPADEPDDD